MKYTSLINNVKSVEWKLNIQQAYLFSWIYELPSWAEKVMIGNEIFYFASKTKAVQELPILTTKTDTMYRYYKQLENCGLIIIKKIDFKDYISLTKKGKSWNESISDNSEINPNALGKESGQRSEINPTYKTINNNKTINNKTLFSVDPISKDILKILNDNKPSKIDFKPTSGNLKDIESRIKDGFKLEDFKKVILFKVQEWKENDKMKKYIRPETLFGSKFNGYLVESESGSSSNNGSNNFKLNPQSKAQLL